MGHAPQAGLDPSYDDRCFFIGPSDQITIHYRSIIWSFSHDAPRRIGIFFSVFLRHGIMVYHGIHVAGTHQKSQSWLSQFLDAGIIFPVRLGYDPHLITIGLQMAADHRRAKGCMIHIGISDDKHKITLLPASLFHIFL